MVCVIFVLENMFVKKERKNNYYQKKKKKLAYM